MLGSKIHRATVTQADLDYEGSLTIPPSLLSLADIAENEAVNVWNVTRGTRFETYAIRGAEGSHDICANGAAAHLAGPGDLVIVATFVLVAEADAPSHEPTIVFVDGQNRPVAKRHEVPGPRRP
jgi:aspartate 1-decarboxylase